MLILGPSTSLKLWQEYRDILLEAREKSWSSTDEVNNLWNARMLPTTEEVDWVHERFGEGGDVFLPDSNRRLKKQMPHVLYAKTGFPSNSLVRVRSDVYCLSPEFIFVKYCMKHSLTESVFVGIELCSMYIRSKDTTAYNQFPAMSIESLRDFLKLNNNISGLKNTRKAEVFLVNRSASPRETALYMLLCLPKRLGGYGFKGAKSNTELSVQSWISKSGVCFSDICWDEEKVCVEYESTEFHSAYTSLQHDSARRVELMHKGYEVVTITNMQMRYIHLFRTAAEVIAKKLGVRLRYDEKFYFHQEELHRMLLKQFYIRF